MKAYIYKTKKNIQYLIISTLIKNVIDYLINEIFLIY